MKYVVSLLVMLSVSLFGVQIEKVMSIEGFSSPEAVYVYKKQVFVSNVGEKLEPLSKDGDGYISLLNEKGEVVEKKYLVGMDAPKGMSVLKKVLYVTDIDTVRGFDLESKKEVFTLKIEGAIFLNDITKGKDKYIYVSDTGTGLIHRINVESKMYKHITKEPLNGVNGLLLDDKEKVMYAVTYVEPHNGRVYKLDMKEKSGEIVPTLYSNLEGMLDGVAKLKDGELVVSNWWENLEGGV